jgi:AcrR family transcriptional regulator
MVLDTEGMRTGLSRDEQVIRNRELVLQAARRVFLAKGYAGATLDAIAEEAGFSKGVVYSQFDSKADLFLALLERRIAERADQNARLAEQMPPGRQVIEAALRLTDQLHSAEPRWLLLVIEFRAHAARDRELNRRYAEMHERTVDGVAALIDDLHRRSGTTPPLPTRVLAELILALSSGAILERVANPRALPGQLVNRTIASLVAPAQA